VVERPVRRTFTAEFKRRILDETDGCAPGDLGAVLRRNALYWSHLTTWRRQREEGTLTGLAPRKRGRKPQPPNPLAPTVAKQEKEIQKLRARAARAERLVELQKKLSEILGIALPTPNDDESGGKR
jgi:transposase-like protein